MRSRRLPPRAFTLFELLLAMSIAVIIAGALASVLYTAFRAKAAAEQAVEATRASDVALAMLDTDLSSALPPTTTYSFVGDNVSVSFYATGTEPKADVPGDKKLITFALTTESVGGITAIRPAAGSGNEQSLARGVTTNILAPVQTDPPQEIICRHVTGFGLRYYDGTAWQDTWDSTQLNNALPLALEVTLDLAPPRPNALGPHIVRIISLPCAVPSSTTPNAVGGAS